MRGISPSHFNLYSDEEAWVCRASVNFSRVFNTVATEPSKQENQSHTKAEKGTKFGWLRYAQLPVSRYTQLLRLSVCFKAYCQIRRTAFRQHFAPLFCVVALPKYYYWYCCTLYRGSIHEVGWSCLCTWRRNDWYDCWLDWKHENIHWIYVIKRWKY